MWKLNFSQGLEFRCIERKQSVVRVIIFSLCNAFCVIASLEHILEPFSCGHTFINIKTELSYSGFYEHKLMVRKYLVYLNIDYVLTCYFYRTLDFNI